MCSMVFTWTIMNFIGMTLAASKMIDICKMWRFLRMDIVKHYMQVKCKHSKTLRLLLLLVKDNNIDVMFTGCGVFNLNRNLLLMMFSTTVSYSVIAITF
ncbi:hypothetical protein HNY73_007584 [Argiope bruennichi]|uniref:Gustatory receptor n=1 Tax=Argiope bruennichi TaxID=94029 RepID=A0A8T0FJV7_ARGBR|nr:hypothetical protein HNY73_007584 [Argiope bruennichi]